MAEAGRYEVADEFTPSESMLSRGMALQKTQTQYTTAIAVQRPRDIDKIQKAVLREAEFAGEDFYYSWTVKSKEGPKTIEGPSIGLTMSLAREWTNCAVDVNVESQGAFDVFTASFIDIERGFTVKRAFKQRKGVAPGRYDADRWEDMEFQKAQSKAIRNVIASGVPRWLVNQAIQKAKESVLSNITKEGLDKASSSAIKFLGQYGVTEDRIIKRVGKPKNEWASEDIAMLRGCASELKDGQVSATALFPEEKETPPPPPPQSKGTGAGEDPYNVHGDPPNQEQGEETGAGEGESAEEVPERGWPCPHCDFMAASERGLKKHITQSHPLQSEGAKKHFGTDSDDIQISGETLPEDPPHEKEQTWEEKGSFYKVNLTGERYQAALKKSDVESWEEAKTPLQRQKVEMFMQSALDEQNA